MPRPELDGGAEDWTNHTERASVLEPTARLTKKWENGKNSVPIELIWRTLALCGAHDRTRVDWHCQPIRNQHCQSINLPVTLRTGGVTRQSQITVEILVSTT